MNQVFYSARCTILLLRDFDLTGIYELYRITQCRFGGTRTSPETTAQQQGHQQHRCLFDPSCITLRAPIPHTLESLCVETLKALWNGTWRKRAWIFQEILLSERYILSWGDAAVIAYIDLETIGYMAAFLQSRYPQESWLHDFWTWCKRCAYIRQFYSENCDMEATILQLAEDLESTLPCDKYYALCGILGLDNIQYNPSHSAGEALDNIVSALTRLGRMGWMYAIPPSVNEGVVLSPHDMAPFVLTRKKKQQSKQQPIDIREPFFTSQLFGVMTLEMGSVNNEETFDQVLRQMHGLEDSMSQLGRNPERRPNFIKDCYMTSSYVHRQFPTILFRLGYDSIGPLCDPKLLRVLFHTLDWGGFNEALFPTNRECCFWFVVVRLCFITPGEINYIAEPDKREVVRISAQHMQRLCQKLHMQNWKVLQWQKPPEDLPKSASQPAEPRLALFNGTLPTFGKTVWSVQTKLSSTSLMFIAGEMQPVAPAPYEYPDGSSAVSPISLSSLDKSGMDLTLRNLKIFRTELSDTSMCFYGVAYQVAQNSPYSTETYKAAFHDSPNEQEEPDDLINRLKRFRIKGSSSSSNLRMSSSQEKRVKFLTFQRKDAQGQPPRPFSPYEQQYYNVHSPVQNFHPPGYPTPNPPLSYSQVPPPWRAAADTPQSPTNPYRPPSNAPLMTSALSYLERDIFANEPPQQQYYPQQNLSPPYDRPREAPWYASHRNPFPYGGNTPPPLLRSTPSPLSSVHPSSYEPFDPSLYGLQELPADLPPAELDSMPMRQPPAEMGPTPVRQSITEPLQEPIITATTTRRDPFVSEFFQEMPTTSELKEMFPLLTEYAIMGIRARHGSNIQAVMDECLNSVASLAIADPEPARVSRKSSLDASQWDHIFRAMEAQTEAMRNQQAERKGKEKAVSMAADSNEAQSSGDAYDQSLAIYGDHRWDRNNVLITEDKRSLQPTPEVIADRLPEYVHQTEDGQERSASFIPPEKTEMEVSSRTEIPLRVGVHSTDSCAPPSLHPIDIPPDDGFTLSQRIASIRRPSGELPSPTTASKAVTRTPEPFMANSVITEALLATKTPNPSTKIGQQPASSLLQAPLTPEIISTAISSTVTATPKGNGTAPGAPLASRSAHASKPKPAVPPKPKSLKVNAHTRSLSHQLTGSRTPTIPFTSTTQSIPNTPTMQAEREAVFSSSPSRAPRLEVQLAPQLEPMQAIQPVDASPTNAPPTETTSSEGPARERTLKREDSYDTLYDAPKDYTAKKKAEKHEKDKQADAWLIDFSDDMSAQVVELKRSENYGDYSVDLLSLLDEPVPLI